MAIRITDWRSRSRIQIPIRISIATLVRHALAEVCTVPVLLVSLLLCLLSYCFHVLMVILFCIITIMVLVCSIYANKYRPGWSLLFPRRSFIVLAQTLWISILDDPVSGRELSKHRVGDVPPPEVRKITEFMGAKLRPCPLVQGTRVFFVVYTSDRCKAQ